MFTEQQLKVIEYCAEEVKRQGDTPNHVYHMLNAWEYADKISGSTFGQIGNPLPDITLDFIDEIGRLVSPDKNANGFRTIPIGVGNAIEWHEKAQPERIVPLLEQLIASYYEGNLEADKQRILSQTAENWSVYHKYKKAKTAEDIFYYEFEEIHPFRDGNGRTGKILYNYLKGTLDNPVWPPNFWNVSNP